MVLLASSFDQSRFFRAEDLTQDKVLRIKSVTEEVVGQGPDQETEAGGLVHQHAQRPGAQPN